MSTGGRSSLVSTSNSFSISLISVRVETADAPDLPPGVMNCIVLMTPLSLSKPRLRSLVRLVDTPCGNDSVAMATFPVELLLRSL